jgi:hypothetical protein
MSMESDLKNFLRAATGTVHDSRCRLRGVQLLEPAAEGTATFRDGGASGTVKVTLHIKNGEQTSYIKFPGRGVLFETDLHVTLDTGIWCSSFYEPG